MVADALSVIHSARPDIPLLPRILVEAIALVEQSLGSAESVANQLGLRNRFQLARVLKHAGLPPLHRLAGWLTILSWVQRVEREHESLCSIAFHSHRHPSACYRLVKEITHCRWKLVVRRGSAWVEQEMLKELRKRVILH